MTAITPEVLRRIDEAGHARVEDPDTRVTYVVLEAAVYDRMRRPIELDVRDGYALDMTAFGADGWDDPVMDEYDALDPRRS